MTADVNFTRETFHEFRALAPLVVISQKVFGVLRELKVKGFRVEPVMLH